MGVTGLKASLSRVVVFSAGSWKICLDKSLEGLIAKHVPALIKPSKIKAVSDVSLPYWAKTSGLLMNRKKAKEAEITIGNVFMATSKIQKYVMLKRKKG
jgi:hypothetical protein